MVYRWECEECKATQDIQRKMSDIDIPPEACLTCHSTNQRRIIARPEVVKGFILLGNSGWEHCEYTKYRSIK